MTILLSMAILLGLTTKALANPACAVCTVAVGASLEIARHYGVDDCVYGHLHGAGLNGAVRGERGTVRYHQVSCDGLGFRLYLLKGEQ